MGFDNPSVPWAELERVLSDRRRPRNVPAGADGGDSPAWSHKRGPYTPPPIERPTDVVPYAELHAHSTFSFLDGASSPEELAEEAERLGLHALAISDHDGFYGIVRFAEAAESLQVKTAFGAELSLGDEDGPRLRRGRGSPIPSARTFSSSRAAKRGTTVSPRPSPTRSCRAPRRGGRSTTSTTSLCARAVRATRSGRC